MLAGAPEEPGEGNTSVQKSSVALKGGTKGLLKMLAVCKMFSAFVHHGVARPILGCIFYFLSTILFTNVCMS